MATIQLAPDFKELLQLPRSAKIQDVLVGGYAVGQFENCYPRREIAEIDGVEVDIISLPDLKTNKRASGRHQDLNDLEKLP
jgi:hypothetical protein